MSHNPSSLLKRFKRQKEHLRDQASDRFPGHGIFQQAKFFEGDQLTKILLESPEEEEEDAREHKGMTRLVIGEDDYGG